MVKKLIIALSVLLFAGVASAAPIFRVERSILPEADSRYYLGTTTPSTNAWLGVVSDQYCLTGDSCISTWPTGGSGGVSGVATTSLLATYPIEVTKTSASILYSLAFGTTTDNTWSGLQTFTNTGTTTFAGSIDIPHNRYLTTHAIRGDASDGLYVVANNYTPVADFGLGNSSNSTFYGGVNIDGTTRLATSLTGLLKASSGAISAASAGTDYENPLTFSFPLSRSANAISFNGLSTSTPAVIGNIPYFTGANTFGNVATTTASCSGSVSCSTFNILGSSPVTITGSSASSPIATSTSETAGRLAYWTSTAGTPATLGEVATTTLTASGALSLSQPISVLGSSASALSIADAVADGSTKGAASFAATDFDSTSGNISIDYTNGQAASAANKGFLTAANWTTFNNKWDLASSTIGVPYGGTGATTLTGLLQGNGTGAITGVTGTIGQFPYYNGTNTLLATSTLSVSTESNVGIASTTPFYKLSVGQAGTSFGTISSAENKLATSTSMTIDWRNGNQQLVQTGTSATSIAFSNALPGTTLRLVVCNPNASAGAITYSGVLWAGGSAPTQTTTANKCDIVSFVATQATSTTQTTTIFGAATANF